MESCEGSWPAASTSWFIKSAQVIFSVRGGILIVSWLGDFLENGVTLCFLLGIPQQMDKNSTNPRGNGLLMQPKAAFRSQKGIKRILTFVVALFLSAQTWARETNIEAASPNTQAFDREVRDSAELLRLPGLSVAVVQNGTIVHRLRLGFSDLDSRTPIGDDNIFWLASVTKTFSAVMLMQYEQEGRLSLDDPLIEYPFASVGFYPQRIEATVRLKHILSHTSEGTPGTAYVYNGARYNFIYGVFEQMSGLKYPQAYTRELDGHIVQRLGLEATLAGYPNTNQNSLRARVVTPYGYDRGKQQFAVNRGALNPGTAYPGTGLLSCIKDLAAYTTALDRDRLLTGSSYRKMTTPFMFNDGRLSEYGLGWFTTEFDGVRLHWAYGLGDSDSAILLRVPSRKLSLILLCNSSFATEASRLGGGNPLTSPFIVTFLKYFVFGKDSEAIDYTAEPAKIRDGLNQRLAKDRHPIHIAELLSQALTLTFTESAFKTPSRQGEALTKLLYDFDRGSFTKNDPAVFYLLLQQSGPELDEASKLAVESYRAAGHFHPWILGSIAERFKAKGDRENSLKYYRLLVEANGFEEAGEKIDAYRILARDYAKQGDLEKARDYFWKAAVYSRQRGGNDADILEEIGQLSNAAKGNTQRPGL
jgi:CubicO group peptidase (beta-lactamase class C family)